MFDDPKGKLRWMEEALLAEEYDETRDEEELEDEEMLLDPDDPDYMDDEIDEGAAVFVDEREERQKRRERRGMVFMGLVSAALIAGMIWWWLQWRN